MASSGSATSVSFPRVARSGLFRVKERTKLRFGDITARRAKYAVQYSGSERFVAVNGHSDRLDGAFDGAPQDMVAAADTDHGEAEGLQDSDYVVSAESTQSRHNFREVPWL